jgi:RNase adapter protein RapZ
MSAAQPDILILSGISGSGKTVVLNTLEDQGYYCIDNLPVGLTQAFVNQTQATDARTKIAIGIDARSRPQDLRNVPQVLSALAASGARVRLLFLECRDDVLVKRYSETRRRHPLSAQSQPHARAVEDSEGAQGLSLVEAIAKDRALMQQIESLADVVIDTSDLNVHQLRRRVVTELGLQATGIAVLFESFAYKKGLPADADFVFDARGLPNPHWDATLRPLSGRDEPVRVWLQQQPEVHAYYESLRDFLERWLPTSDSSERAYVTVAIGCTGGRHRSVYLVERLCAHFRQQRSNVMSFHREQGV